MHGLKLVHFVVFNVDPAKEWMQITKLETLLQQVHVSELIWVILAVAFLVLLAPLVVIFYRQL